MSISNFAYARIKDLTKLTCFQGNKKKKMSVKFDDLNLLRSRDIKGIMTPENGPQSFGTFEKRTPVYYQVLKKLPLFNKGAHGEWSLFLYINEAISNVIA